MLPGHYLEKRRLMAGYSLSSLARELLMLTGFGSSRAESDFRRLRMVLISAEQGSLHHRADRIDLIRNFVPLDPAVYFRLVEIDESGVPFPVEGLCSNCACSFQDPCVVPVAPTAALGTSVCETAKNNGGGTDLCSACALTVSRPTTPRLQQLIAQLHALGAARPAVRPVVNLACKTGEH